METLEEKQAAMRERWAQRQRGLPRLKSTVVTRRHRRPPYGTIRAEVSEVSELFSFAMGELSPHAIHLLKVILDCALYATNNEVLRNALRTLREITKQPPTSDAP